MIQPEFRKLYDEFIAVLEGQGSIIDVNHLDGLFEITVLDKSALNLGKLASGVLSPFGDVLSALPEPLRDALDVSLTFVRIDMDARSFQFAVAFNQSFGFDPFFEVQSPQVTVHWAHGHFAAVIETEVQMGLPLAARIEVPGIFVEAWTTGEQNRLADLLRHFHLDPSGVGPFADVNLRTGRVSLSTIAKQAHIEIELEDVLDLGVLELEELTIALDYGWNEPASLSAACSAQVHLAIPGHPIDVGLWGSFETGEGWTFSLAADLASVSLGDLVDWLCSKLGVSAGNLGLPDSLRAAHVKEFAFAYHSQNQGIEIDVTVGFGPAGDAHPTELELTLSSAREAHKDNSLHAPLPSAAPQPGQQKPSRSLHVEGTLYLHRGDLEKEVQLAALFDSGDDHSDFVAVFHPETPKGVTLNDLAKAIGLDLAEVPDLTVDVVGLAFARLSQGPGTGAAPPPTRAQDRTGKTNADLASGGANLLSLEVGGSLDLSGLGSLPLIGSTIGDAASLHLAFKLLYASRAVTDAGTLDRGNKLLAGYNMAFPPQTPAGLTVDADLKLGADKKPLKLTFGAGEQDAAAQQTRTLGGQDAAAPEPAPAEGATASGEVVSDDITWVDIERDFGPLNVARVGFTYRDQHISAYLDATLSLGVFKITLMGLSASVKFPVEDLGDLSPSFGLQGLGVSFEKGTLSISGAFLADKATDLDTGQPIDCYSGNVMVRTAKFTLSALGSFAELSDGAPSGFIYGTLNAPLGGPPAFFVEGLAAGFGYNRDLITPTDLVHLPEHWLVRDALSPPEPGTAGIGTGNAAVEKLRQVSSSVVPKRDQYFVAAGIKFSSFKLLDNFVLLTVAFGKRFELNVFGITTLQIPPKPAPKTLAKVQLAIQARLAPDEGIVSVRGVLTDQSFVLTPDCHLTGGFAFAAWYDGPHSGDFVVTLGGYHPKFDRPSHYLTAPRVGLNWVVNQHLSIKAGMYFALTPGALMAGGLLNAVWTSDEANAWFKIGADFLINWEPFHYDITAFISVHAEAKVDTLFGTESLSLDAHASLHIWGPDFGGHAEITATVLGFDADFDVDFGAEPAKPDLIPWERFRTAYLEGSPILAASVSQGMTHETASSGTRYQCVQPKAFVLRLDTVVPIRQIVLGEKNSALVEEIAGGDTQLARNTEALKACPTGKRITASRLRVSISDGSEDITGSFAHARVEKRMPTALWGSAQPGLNDKDRVLAFVAGLELSPRPEETDAGIWHEASRDDLAYHDEKVDPAQLDRPTDGPRWQGVQGPITLHARMHDPDVKAARARLLQALGGDIADEFIWMADPLAVAPTAPAESGTA